MAEAKAKIKARHLRAISTWLGWCKANPTAKKKRRIAEFDACVDAEAFSSEIKVIEKDRLRAGQASA